jgi:hypothetical protein
MTLGKKKVLTCSNNKNHICTFSSPAADIFTSFIFHPTAIDDSGPKASCICEREGGKNKTKKMLSDNQVVINVNIKHLTSPASENGLNYIVNIIKFLMDHLIFLYTINPHMIDK